MEKEDLIELYKKYKEAMDKKISELHSESERALRLSQSTSLGGGRYDWNLVRVALHAHDEMVSACDALQVQTRIYKDKLSEFENDH